MLVDKKLIDEELDKYKLKFNRKKRKKIEESANYEELGKILNFLINNLHISKRSIEKCPSILYRKKSSIRNNYLFLEDKKIYNYLIGESSIKFSDGVECLLNKSLKEDGYV